MIYINNEELFRKHVPWVYAQGTIAIDTETTGLDPLVDKIVLLQLGNEQKQLVFDAKLGRMLTDMLNNISPMVKILHNAVFDYKFIKTNFGISLDNIRCTMLAHQLLTAGRIDATSNLADLCEKFLSVKLDKEEQVSFLKKRNSFTEKQLNYAALDVKYLIPLYKKLNDLIIARNMDEVAELEYHTVEVTGDMELNGVTINKEKWRALEKVAKDHAYAKKQILDEYFLPYCETDLFGEPVINYNSPKQLLPILSKIVGVRVTSTEKPVLETIDHPAVDDLLTYRKYQKLKSTYGQSFLDQHVRGDGKLHTSFKQHGTATGRYSSRDPKIGWDFIW